MDAQPDSPGGPGVMGRPVKVEEEMRVPVSQDAVSYESISSFEDRGRGHGQWVLGSLGTRKKAELDPPLQPQKGRGRANTWLLACCCLSQTSIL